MNLIKEQYRELLNEMNPLGMGRFVYEKVAEPAPEASKADSAKVEAPLTAEQVKDKFKKQQEDLTAKNLKLVETYKQGGTTPQEDQAISKYATKVEAVTKSYAEKIDKVPAPDAEAQNAVHAETQSLIDEISDRIKTGSTETKEDVEAKDKFIKDNLPVLTNKLVAAVGVRLSGDNPELNKLIPVLLAKLDQSQLDAALKGPLAITPEQTVAINKEIVGQLAKLNGKIETGEQDLVMELGKAEGKPAYLKDLDLGKNTALNEMIARKFTITKDKDNILLVDGQKLDDGAWEKMVPKPKDGEPALDPKALEATAKNEVQSRKALESMTTMLQGDKAPEKMGLAEIATMVLQLWQTLQTALKDGDFGTLNDMMSDFNAKPLRNPADSMRASGDAYANKLKEGGAKPADLLLSAYLKPRGPEAEELFLKKGMTPQEREAEKLNPLSRYRNEAKTAIEEHLKTSLGLTSIQEISKVGERTVIDASRGGQRISVEFYKDVSGKLQAEVVPMNPAAKEGDPAVRGAIVKIGDGKTDITLSQVGTEISKFKGTGESMENGPQFKKVAEFKLALKKIDTTDPKQFNKLIGENIKTATDGLLKYLNGNRKEAEKLMKENDPNMSVSRWDQLQGEFNNFLKEVQPAIKKMLDAVKAANGKPIEQQKKAIAEASSDFRSVEAGFHGVGQSFIPFNFEAASHAMQDGIFGPISVEHMVTKKGQEKTS